MRALDVDVSDTKVEHGICRNCVNELACYLQMPSRLTLITKLTNN